MAENSAILIDTVGWIANLSATDTLHNSAVEQMRQFARARRKLITTTWIIAETGNGLARTPARLKFVEAVRAWKASPNVEILEVDSQLFDASLELYAKSRDKQWGMVDCVSFVLMRRMRLTDAFTADVHFQQAGFNCLLPIPK